MTLCRLAKLGLGYTKSSSEQPPPNTSPGGREEKMAQIWKLVVK